MHHIQKYILRTLTYTKRARFSEMRPPKVDSNAYSYHLKVLQKDGYVEKTDRGYRLSPHGLGYVDRISVEKFEPRLQPKIITMLVSHDDAGRVLLWPKKKQPFIGAWSLPNGKMHVSDRSLLQAASREAIEKFGTAPESVSHRGSCLIRAYVSGELISYVLAHVFTVTLLPGQQTDSATKWCDETARKNLKLLPATEQIIQKVEADDGLFYEEYDVDW